MAEAQTSIGIQREAPFLEDYRRRLMDSVFKAGDKAIKPLQREITGFQPFQQAGMGLGAEQLGYSYNPQTGQLTESGEAIYEPYMQQAMSTTQMGLPALASAQGQYDPSTSNYQQFFDTYQSDVTDAAMRKLDEEGMKAQNQLAGQAVQGGVFGGSRYGVQQGELAKNLQNIKSQRLFEDMSRNFQQAQAKSMQSFESARARDMGAAQGLMGLGQSFANLGQQNFGLGQQGLSGLMNLGQQQQTQQQARADESLRYGTALQQEPLQRLGFIGDQLNRVPSVQQTFSQQPIPYTNPIVGAVGAGMAGLGSFMGSNS